MQLSLDVPDLALVREIAEAGSVTRAGAKLNLTQSALSHRLRAMESRLGVPLFLRLGKKMVLTPAGQRVLVAAESVIGELGRAEDELRVLAREGSGVLRLCTQCYTGYHWLPPLLQQFHAKHPGVEVQIAVDSTYRPVEALLENEIDLGVLTRTVEDKRLLVRPLFEDEMVVVVAPSHPLAAHAFIDPAQLASEHLLAYKTERRDNFLFSRILEPHGVQPARMSRVPLTEAILEMVKAGLGVAVLARWAIEPSIASGAVRAVRITRRGVIREWQVATLRSRPEPQWQADFIEMLRRHGPGVSRPAARRLARAT